MSVVADLQDEASYRRCMSRFATGVAIVTAADAQGQVYGVTVSSLLSISLRPRLVGWTLQTGKPAAAFFLACDHYRVHILTAGQEALARRFAGPPPHRFGAARPSADAWNSPMLDQPLAHVNLRRHGVHEIGDHQLFVGEVVAYADVDAASASGKPLLYYDATLGWTPLDA